MGMADECNWYREFSGTQNEGSDFVLIIIICETHRAPSLLAAPGQLTNKTNKTFAEVL